MKKVTKILILFLCCHVANGQENTLETKNFAGTYVIGNVQSKQGGSKVTVFPESDSTVLIYVYIQNGAPSYNFGRLYGRVKIFNGKGHFIRKNDTEDSTCHWVIEIDKAALIVTTINSQFDVDLAMELMPMAGIKKYQVKYLSTLFRGMEKKYTS